MRNTTADLEPAEANQIAAALHESLRSTAETYGLNEAAVGDRAARGSTVRGRGITSRVGDGVTHVRIATLNLWSVGGMWNGRRDVLRRGFRDLQPDVIHVTTGIATNGTLIYRGADAWQGIIDSAAPGPCTQLFEIHGTSRTVAGAPFDEELYKCALQSVDAAVARGLYGSWRPSVVEVALLKQIFPSGVCDYSKGDAGRPDLTLSLSATVNQQTFTVGQSLSVGGTVIDPGLPAPAAADFYVGILRPNGSIQFFTNAGIVLGNVADVTSFRPLAVAVPLGTPFSVDAPSFYTHQWTAGDPHGGYVFFVAAVKTGALAGGTVPSDQILGLATASFSFP